MKKICITALAIVLLLSSQSMAHDWWLNRSDSGFEIVKGHVEGDGGKFSPYEADRVIHAAGYRDNGQVVPITVTWKKDKFGSYIFPPEKFSAITAFVYNKYWMITTEGGKRVWKNDKVEGNFEVIEEGQSFKYTKHIEKWHNFLTEPLGQRFEIVPLKDPTRMKKGDLLPVKIFHMGKELQSVRLTKISKTHNLELIKNNGIFYVQVAQKGLQFVNAKVEVPVKDKEVIWYAASLTFYTSK
ncbi:MAG: DUF4198 domain-containing protein [Deltaproteobacteria bacterium]|nr:DUF4198 domain-containing protein [Deltaproteobacteria bacterium]